MIMSSSFSDSATAPESYLLDYDVDEATAVADFAPFYEYYSLDPGQYGQINAEIDLVDDCDVEKDEIFRLDIYPKLQAKGEYSEISIDEDSVIIKDNDG